MTRRFLITLAALAALWLPPAGAALAQQDFGLDNVILDTTGLWRYRMVWETEQVQLESGEVGHWIYKRDDRTKQSQWVKADNVVVLPADTPADWFKPDFDDSTWARFRGPFTTFDIGAKNLCLRAGFDVPERETAGQLELALSFYGGVVAYVNGKEIGRAFMPEGKIELSTPATPYPREAYVNPEGFILTRYEAKACADRFQQRTRVAHFKFPRNCLLEGVNTVAVSVHRPPADHIFYSHRIKAFPENGVQSRDATWGRLALSDVKLIAPPGSSVVPDFTRPQGFQVWNPGLGNAVHAADYRMAGEPLYPVRIVGVRNGLFPGQLVIGSSEPIVGLKVERTDLKGPGTIPASAVEVCYGLPDGEERRWKGKLSVGAPFDSLDDTQPAEVPVRQDGNGALVPIYLNVKIPPDAAPGDYEGQITLRANGLEPVTVPLKLTVIDWLMPDSTDFAVRPDFVQSPESVALRYGVPMWSDEHFALLDRTFKQLGRLANKSLYVSCVRRTHYGNEHAMIRWIRGSDGRLTPDFSVAERYLDTAVRHLGRIPAVVLYAWEPPESAGHAGFGPGRTHDRDILISVLDPDTGELTAEQGPRWGSREARELWKPLVEGWRRILEKRGLGSSLAFGMVGDHRPTKQAMDDVCASAPKAPWAVHSHHYADSWQGYPVAFCAAVWGIGARVVDPAEGYGYGWLNRFWLASYPRGVHPGSPLGEYLSYAEMYLGAVPGDYHYWSAQRKALGTGGVKGVGGIGRVGADFWKCVGQRGGQFTASIAGRYPETAWGQLNITYGTSHVLGVGTRGPVATYRSEAYRLNFQEIEARVFVERALLDDDAKAKIGDELAGRCQQLLDNRIRASVRANQSNGWAWYVGSGWQQRGEQLFRLAAEVAAKLSAK